MTPAIAYRYRRGPCLAALALVGLSSGFGCGLVARQPPAGVAPPQQTTAAPPTSNPPTYLSPGEPPRSSAASRAPSRSGSSAPAPQLRTSRATIAGRSGSVSWRIGVPVFSGASAAAEVNRRIEAATHDLIALARSEGSHDAGVHRTLDGDGRVVTNDGRTAQVSVVYTDYLTGTAHPSDYVTTTVVDVRAKAPVVLSAVFSQPTAAFRALKPEIMKAARSKGEEITEPAGLAPRAKNWAAWQTTPAGMTFWFGDYQLGGHGLRSYTVPWPVVGPLMSARARALLGPA